MTTTIFEEIWLYITKQVGCGARLRLELALRAQTKAPKNITIALQFSRGLKGVDQAN